MDPAIPDINISDVVVSTAGHDQGNWFYVIREDPEFLYLANGKRLDVPAILSTLWNDRKGGEMLFCANYLTHETLEPPFVCLVASGGHSHILMVEDYGVYKLLGCTQDDAAGEAFDKAARVLHLPYPGGPLLDKMAQSGNPQALKLPRPHTPGEYDFSFSGLKTAFINACHNLEQKGQTLPAEDLAASFQHAVVDQLLHKTMQAARDYQAPRLALAGGVSANSGLRAAFEKACKREGIQLFMPQLKLCGDNAAMIGSAAYYRLLRDEVAPLSLNAKPALRLV